MVVVGGAVVVVVVLVGVVVVVVVLVGVEVVVVVLVGVVVVVVVLVGVEVVVVVVLVGVEVVVVVLVVVVVVVVLVVVVEVVVVVLAVVVVAGGVVAVEVVTAVVVLGGMVVVVVVGVVEASGDEAIAVVSGADAASVLAVVESVFAHAANSNAMQMLTTAAGTISGLVPRARPRISDRPRVPMMPADKHTGGYSLLALGPSALLCGPVGGFPACGPLVEVQRCSGSGGSETQWHRHSSRSWFTSGGRPWGWGSQRGALPESASCWPLSDGWRTTTPRSTCGSLAQTSNSTRGDSRSDPMLTQGRGVLRFR